MRSSHIGHIVVSEFPHTASDCLDPEAPTVKRLLLAALAAALTLSAHPGATAARDSLQDDPGGGRSFRPLARFMVPTRTSAEIVSATPDGETLVYTDATNGTVGIVDISDPAHPTQTHTIPTGGSPTSVAVTPDGLYALVAVKVQAYGEGEDLTTLPDPVPGRLLLISLVNPAGAPVVYQFPNGPGGAIGYQPDSVALTTVGGVLYAVVALENEPIVVVEDGLDLVYLAPEPAGVSPCPTVAPFEFDGDSYEGCDLSDPGYVQVVRVNTSAPSLTFVSNIGFPATDMAGLDYPADAQPEFVATRGTRVAVTLQENNGFAVIDLTTPASPTREIFSAGTVNVQRADLTDNAEIDFSETYPADALADQPDAGKRVPDGIAWDAEGGQLFLANEGEFDYTGGRGWSAFSASGSLLWDDQGQLEQIAVTRGSYPDGRSDAKGIETEGVTTGVFGAEEFAFVTSERGAFVAVYRLVGWGQPRFQQLLPTGLGPEAVLAIPSRGLFVTADEGDDGAEGSISIFESVRGQWKGTADRPLLESSSVDEAWSALSGFAADPANHQRLYSVPDNALPTSIFQIDVDNTRARVRELVKVTKNGVPQRYDLEGIAIDTSKVAPAAGAGFWLAHEGNASCTVSAFQPNLLIQVDANGAWLQEVRLPTVIEPDRPTTPACSGSQPTGTIASNGFEGLAITPDGQYILVAIQRPFKGEAPGSGATHTRIGRYNVETGAWDFFAYPLFVSADKTIGLSEITLMGGNQAGQPVWGVIERDNRYGITATWKRVFTFTLPAQSCAAGQTLAQCVAAGALITKSSFEDLSDDYFPLEKVESLAVTRSGDVWTALDNDGGEIEPRMVRIRRGR